jgi:hypothetical protein
LDNKQIWLINLYGPNNDDPSFFENIYKNWSTLQATLDSIIMVGDFNSLKYLYGPERKSHYKLSPSGT